MVCLWQRHSDKRWIAPGQSGFTLLLLSSPSTAKEEKELGDRIALPSTIVAEGHTHKSASPTFSIIPGSGRHSLSFDGLSFGGCRHRGLPGPSLSRPIVLLDTLTVRCGPFLRQLSPSSSCSRLLFAFFLRARYRFFHGICDEFTRRFAMCEEWGLYRGCARNSLRMKNAGCLTLSHATSSSSLSS